MAYADVETAAWQGTGKIDFVGLRKVINDLTLAVENQLEELSKRDSVKVPEMFDMQFKMNNLTQFTEMASSVLSGIQTISNTMARGAKG